MPHYKTTILTFLLLTFTSCGTLFQIPESSDDSGADTSPPIIEGTPSAYSQTIYASSNLNTLCLDESCQPDYEALPTTYKEIYSTQSADLCAFDFNPNATSRFVLQKSSQAINGLRLLFSKEDLFFLAWTSMRQKINPHFLMGVMAQESYGNCAAVSSAAAEGCFQITNYYGRLQLEQSYADRVSEWFWAFDPTDYYLDSLFINPLTWFGESPSTDQFRMTLDPASDTVLATEVSSVVNFHFGAIASALYFNWEQYFLYYNYSSLRTLTTDLIATPEEKASLMAAAYNGGITRLSSSLSQYESDYLSGMRSETQDYVVRVLDYCEQFQQGSLNYSANYNSDEIDYIIDLLSYTYPSDLGIDWQGLKTEVQTQFFATQTELSFTDDVKALIYFISTYDSRLAPEGIDL